MPPNYLVISTWPTLHALYEFTLYASASLCTPLPLLLVWHQLPSSLHGPKKLATYQPSPPPEANAKDPPRNRMVPMIPISLLISFFQQLIILLPRLPDQFTLYASASLCTPLPLLLVWHQLPSSLHGPKQLAIYQPLPLLRPRLTPRIRPLIILLPRLHDQFTLYASASLCTPLPLLLVWHQLPSSLHGPKQLAIYQPLPLLRPRLTPRIRPRKVNFSPNTATQSRTAKLRTFLLAIFLKNNALIKPGRPPLSSPCHGVAPVLTQFHLKPTEKPHGNSTSRWPQNAPTAFNNNNNNILSVTFSLKTKLDGDIDRIVLEIKFNLPCSWPVTHLLSYYNNCRCNVFPTRKNVN
eukprot:sb/3466198/